MRRSLMAAVLVLGLAAGCKAQNPSPATPEATTNRRIEVLVRSHFSLPPDVEVTLGERKPSEIPGYDTMAIKLARGGHEQSVDFLISKDQKTLARLETYSLEKDPIFSIATEDRPIRGGAGAKVTVVNFDDLECPYCARMHQQLFPDTVDRYKGLVRFVYKDFPLTEIHPWAMRASVDANCLGAQNTDAYWNFVDYVHAHGQEVNGSDRDPKKSFEALDRIAREHGTLSHLDAGKLDACLAAQDETKIRASMKEAMDLGVDGTPAIFVAGERVSGVVPEEQLWKIIDRALRSAGVEPPAAPAAPAPSAGAGSRR